MSHKIVVHKARTNVLTVHLGMDISGSTFASQIRTAPDVNAPLIAEWDVDFTTDGTDGSLTLILDNTLAAQIQESSGFMDIKRISGGEPIAVFDRPLEVEFRGSVTE